MLRISLRYKFKAFHVFFSTWTFLWACIVAFLFFLYLCLLLVWGFFFHYYSLMLLLPALALNFSWRNWHKVIRHFSQKLKNCHINEEIGKCLNSTLIKDANPLEVDFYVTFMNSLIKRTPRDVQVSSFKDPRDIYF